MSTLHTFVGTEKLDSTELMPNLNSNFSALNTDKIETSVLDTDTSLSANSDSKIATQKAVKTYIDTSGGQNASETVRGIVEEATDAEVTAGTATGATGAKLFITPAKLATASGETGVSKIVKTKSTGLLDSSIVPGYIGTPFFYQRVQIPTLTTSGSLNSAVANSSGSVLILYSTDATELFRYARDTNTGIYYQTHNVSSTIGSSPYSSAVIVGNYVYVFWDNNTVISCYRYDLADLANETSMTVPSVDTAGANYAVSTWTDGTYIYLSQAKASTTGYKFSISGTTFTTVTTSTTAAPLSSTGNVTFMYDGTNTYGVSISSSAITIRKASDAFFSASTNTTINTGTESDATIYSICIPIDTNRMYIGYLSNEYNATAQIKVVMILTPYTKP